MMEVEWVLELKEGVEAVGIMVGILGWVLLWGWVFRKLDQWGR